MTTGRTLQVYCFERLAGVLVDAPDSLSFSYASQWLADGQPPLSQSLPLQGTFGADAVAAFFGGLLPEGEPLQQLGRTLGVSTANVFAMLEVLGGDMAGAISVFAGGWDASVLGEIEAVISRRAEQLAAITLPGG